MLDTLSRGGSVVVDLHVLGRVMHSSVEVRERLTALVAALARVPPTVAGVFVLAPGHDPRVPVPQHDRELVVGADLLHQCHGGPLDFLGRCGVRLSGRGEQCGHDRDDQCGDDVLELHDAGCPFVVV